jgi:fermentation-respiration switch protein FrsA (DUF1100 family)
MRFWMGLLAVALGLAALLLVLWLAQRRLIYFPYGGPVPHPGAAGLPTASEVTVRTEDDLDLGAWFVEPTGPALGWTLILLNGNAGHRAFRAPLAGRLADRGIGVLMLDYRGYGGNPGAPTERGLLLDARAARRWLDRRLAGHQTRVGYLGESLGTGVAVALAVEREPDAVILRSPYTSLADVARYHYPLLPTDWLLRDRYPSEDRIRRVSCPILIIAAERDSIVPVTLSRRLFEAASPTARHWFLLPGADHNDEETLAGDAVIDAMVGFLEDRAHHPGPSPIRRR